MSSITKIKKGLNINLIGEAEKSISNVSSKFFALKPTDFIGVLPKLHVKEGDEVKAGTILFHDKNRENILFTSPVSGTVKEIKRGEKRLLLEIVIESDGKFESLDFIKGNPNELDRESVVGKLIESGLWTMIRQRPYSVIANPEETPKAIFISAFDTAPLAPDFDFVVECEKDAFQTGLNVVSKLTNGEVHLNVDSKNTKSKVFLEAENVQVNLFEGPHPTGNVGVQINKIDPINKGDVVWYLYPQDVIAIGKLFLTGKYDSTRIFVVTGSEVLHPAYFRSHIGSSIEPFVENNISDKEKRFISGNVLTGNKVEKDGFVGFYHNQLTVIPEGSYYELLGWGMPGFGKFSVSRTFPAGLFGCKNKKYKVDTNYHGAERAYVVTGQFEKVFPFDIYPLQLIKAILAEDIDLMEQLGIYEVDEEDFALCEVVDTSKTEIQKIVRQGLDLMRKEMN